VKRGYARIWFDQISPIETIYLFHEKKKKGIAHGSPPWVLTSRLRHVIQRYLPLQRPADEKFVLQSQL
jgi:hypothetical protein